MRTPYLLVFVALFSCHKADNNAGDDDDDDDVPTATVTAPAGAYTYTLEQTGGLTLWTAPVTHKVREGEAGPVETGSGVHFSAARGEFEVAQLVVGPGQGTVGVELTAFPDLPGAAVSLEMASFELGWAETLAAVSDVVPLRPDSGVPLWITVKVPDDAPAGLHTATLRLSPSSGPAVEVPIELTVFDFSIPAASPFATQVNIDVGSLVGSGNVDDSKQLLFDLRLTPKSVPWPSGFSYNITWDNASAADPCGTFWDEPTEPNEYSIGWLAERYIHGTGWNGVGFPTAMAFQFVDNSTPRPDTFCGIARGDHYGTAAYNDEWSDFLGGLEGYLAANAYLDEVYYYVQNEPQDDEDARLAAHLCRLTKAAAPQLRIAISEEPKPEIAEHADGGCGYDIWIAHTRAYAEDYAHERQRDHGEEVWLYSLDQDPDPYFNPTMADAEGMHARIIPWASWGLRVTGWAYYDGNRFFHNGRPGVRAALLREGIEDYAYLWLANGSAHPAVDGTPDIDATAKSVASSMTSWTRDPDALAVLRHELGRYIEGSRSTIPVLETDDEGVRPAGAYFVNFQDPGGSPSADPLEVDGDTWMKVGWSAWDDEAGYGWYGEYVDDPGIALYGYDDAGGYPETERSYLYDDYGRDNLFEFAIENGTYDVTLGLGRPARGYPDDPHNATVEGTVVVDDVITTDADPVVVTTTTVTVSDGRLSVEVGGLSELSGNWAYTFVSFLSIEPTP